MKTRHPLISPRIRVLWMGLAMALLFALPLDAQAQVRPNGQVTVMPGGLWLTRVYDANSKVSIDAQCGSLDYYKQLFAQIQRQVSYYNSPDGTNKFFKRVGVTVYAPGVPFPSSTDEAHCQERNGLGDSNIDIVKFPDVYKFEGALSHEMGHAYHNWTLCFTGTTPRYGSYGAIFTPFFERQISENGSTWSATGKPWYQPWGPGKGRDENKLEQFANVFRYFMGADVTRGQSGPGTKDPVVPGFKDPAKNPHWGKQLRLLPELTGYWNSYGIQNGTLSWQDGADGYWQFKNAAGQLMVQKNYYEWYEVVAGRWQRVSPRYTVN
jgi:hypothetical protein